MGQFRRQVIARIRNSLGLEPSVNYWVVTIVRASVQVGPTSSAMSWCHGLSQLVTWAMYLINLILSWLQSCSERSLPIEHAAGQFHLSFRVRRRIASTLSPMRRSEWRLPWYLRMQSITIFVTMRCCLTEPSMSSHVIPSVYFPAKVAWLLGAFFLSWDVDNVSVRAGSKGTGGRNAVTCSESQRNRCMRLDKSQLSFRARPVSQTGRLSLVHYSDCCRSKTSNVSSEFGLPAIVSAPFCLFVQYFLNHFAQSREVNLHSIPVDYIACVWLQPIFIFTIVACGCVKWWQRANSVASVACCDMRWPSTLDSTLHILHFKNSELLARTKFINAIVPKNRAGMEPYQWCFRVHILKISENQNQRLIYNSNSLSRENIHSYLPLTRTPGSANPRYLIWPNWKMQVPKNTAEKHFLIIRWLRVWVPHGPFGVLVSDPPSLHVEASSHLPVRQLWLDPHTCNLDKSLSDSFDQSCGRIRSVIMPMVVMKQKCIKPEPLGLGILSSQFEVGPIQQQRHSRSYFIASRRATNLYGIFRT